MNIGFDASRANRKAKTGTEWYSYNLLRELAKIDKKNRYFLYSPDKLSGGLANLPENFEEKVLNWPPKYLWTMLRLSVEMLINSPDILFVPAHIIPLIAPQNTITTIMDVGFLRRPEVYPQKELKYHRFGLWQALKKAKKILTISEFSKSEMVDLCNINEDRIKVIHLGFDSGIFRPIDNDVQIEQVLKKYNIDSDSKYLLYVGRLEEKKNTPGLIKAFGQFKKENPENNYKLVLAGSPGHNYEQITQIIKEYNIEDDVIETGWVEENDLPNLFNGSLAFIFPSFYEGFGIPLLEAMSCHTPILTSNVASIPEVAGDAALYFNPNDISDMKEKIKKIVSDSQLRKELTNRGISRIKNFSWEKCAKKTLEEIESI